MDEVKNQITKNAQKVERRRQEVVKAWLRRFLEGMDGLNVRRWEGEHTSTVSLISVYRRDTSSRLKDSGLSSES